MTHVNFYNEVIPQVLLIATALAVCVAHLLDQLSQKKTEARRKIQAEKMRRKAEAKRKHLERYGLENHA